MQPELKEKIRSRDRVCGIVFFVVLMVVFLPTFYFLYPTINNPPRRQFNLPGQFWALVPTAILLGASIGYVMLAAVWFAFSDDGLLRRFQFLFFFCLIAWEAWFLGYLSQMSATASVWRHLDEPVIASAVLPVFFLGVVLPLVWFRSIFGRAFVSVWEDPTPRQSLNVLDLILWTTFLAIAGGGFRIATSVFNAPSEALEPVAVGFMICFGVSSIVVLPSAILMLSKRISFFFASIGVLFAVTVLASLIGNWLLGNDGLMMTWGAVSATSICGFGYSVIRFFGLRLQVQPKHPPRIAGDAR